MANNSSSPHTSYYFRKHGRKKKRKPPPEPETETETEASTEGEQQ